MSTNPTTPAEQLAAADEKFRDLVRQTAAARIERDRLVHDFRTHGDMSDAAMAEVLRGHRSWPQHLADAFPERLRRFNAAKT